MYRCHDYMSYGVNMKMIRNKVYVVTLFSLGFKLLLFYRRLLLTVGPILMNCGPEIDLLNGGYFLKEVKLRLKSSQDIKLLNNNSRYHITTITNDIT